MPIIQDQVDTLINPVNGSLTGVAATLAGNSSLFYVLALVSSPWRGLSHRPRVFKPRSPQGRDHLPPNHFRAIQ